jgi:hypothetical protein
MMMKLFSSASAHAHAAHEYIQIYTHGGARAATQHDEPDAKREIAKMPRAPDVPMCCCSPSSTINKLFFVLA